jgi:hypothetical protein
MATQAQDRQRRPLIVTVFSNNRFSFRNLFQQILLSARYHDLIRVFTIFCLPCIAKSTDTKSLRSDHSIEDTENTVIITGVNNRNVTSRLIPSGPKARMLPAYSTMVSTKLFAGGCKQPQHDSSLA